MEVVVVVHFIDFPGAELVNSVTVKLKVHLYVFSHLDYCNTARGNTTKANVDKVYTLQKRGARLIYEDVTSSSNVRLHNLHWLPFIHRVKHNKAVIMYKCMTNKAPFYLSNTFTYQSNTSYLLRSDEHHNLHVPESRTELYPVCHTSGL